MDKKERSTNKSKSTNNQVRRKTEKQLLGSVTVELSSKARVSGLSANEAKDEDSSKPEG
jgi:hypothetical protein